MGGRPRGINSGHDAWLQGAPSLAQEGGGLRVSATTANREDVLRKMGNFSLCFELPCASMRPLTGEKGEQLGRQSM